MRKTVYLNKSIVKKIKKAILSVLKILFLPRKDVVNEKLFHKKNITLSVFLFTGYLMKAQQANPKRFSYDLFVKDTTVNYTGKNRHAIAINGQIPGPTIELTEGDTAIIRVHNLMHVTTSIHWHGILIPNQYDGVPELTTFPIQPDSTLTVVFPVRQNATYWYHSHTMTQEQIGLTGSIVIQKRDEQKIKEEVLVLNDWANLKPSEVLRLLKSHTVFFLLKKILYKVMGKQLTHGILAIN
jgi:FtsP/CotA-like multicopper oxidase with cupredoxin domain